MYELILTHCSVVLGGVKSGNIGKHISIYRMGSFNSAPKILNDDTQDNDLDIPDRMSREEILEFCRKPLENTPSLIHRNFVHLRPTQGSVFEGKKFM